MHTGEHESQQPLAHFENYMTAPPVIPNHINNRIAYLKEARQEVVDKAIDINSEVTKRILHGLDQRIIYISQEFGLGYHLMAHEGIPLYIYNPDLKTENDVDKSLADGLPFIFDEILADDNSSWGYHEQRRESKISNRKKLKEKEV